MMTKKLRVVHYINQFYAQFGGEDTAGMGIVVKEEAMGPGLLINKFLGDAGEIVGTICCGDNFIAENLEAVTAQVVGLPTGSVYCRPWVQCRALRPCLWFRYGCRAQAAEDPCRYGPF